MFDGLRIWLETTKYLLHSSVRRLFEAGNACLARNERGGHDNITVVMCLPSFLQETDMDININKILTTL